MRTACETISWLRLEIRHAKSDAEELVEKGADQEDLQFQYGKAAAFQEALDYITERYNHDNETKGTG